MLSFTHSARSDGTRSPHGSRYYTGTHPDPCWSNGTLPAYGFIYAQRGALPTGTQTQTAQTLLVRFRLTFSTQFADKRTHPHRRHQFRWIRLQDSSSPPQADNHTRAHLPPSPSPTSPYSLLTSARSDQVRPQSPHQLPSSSRRSRPSPRPTILAGTAWPTAQ